MPACGYQGWNGRQAMDETIHHFLRETGPVLCLDIGSGTQDALLARPGLSMRTGPVSFCRLRHAWWLNVSAH